MSGDLKGSYGGRVEFIRMPSRWPWVIALDVACTSFALFAFSLWKEAYPLASFFLIASGVAWRFHSIRYRQYKIEVERRKHVVYYDIDSAYPPSLRDGYTKPFLHVLESKGEIHAFQQPPPWWTCKGCGRNFPSSGTDLYYSSDYCTIECLRRGEKS